MMFEDGRQGVKTTVSSAVEEVVDLRRPGNSRPPAANRDHRPSVIAKSPGVASPPASASITVLAPGSLVERHGHPSAILPAWWLFAGSIAAGRLP
jgi:hypothetical protein